MLGLFGRMTTTDDTEEHLWQQGERQNIDASLDLQVRMRTQHVHDLEERINDDIREKSRLKRSLREREEQLALSEAENQRLREQQEALRETAINIAIDRKAIFNTIEYLNKKWNKNSPKSPESKSLEEQGVLMLFDEAEEIRVQEYNKIRSNAQEISDIEERVEHATQKKVTRNRQRKKTP